jgi:hypothetical protein
MVDMVDNGGEWNAGDERGLAGTMRAARNQNRATIEKAD